MVDQEKVIGGASPSQPAASTGGMNDIGHRLVTLLELQTELFRIDLRNGVKRLVAAFLLLCAVVLAGIASACILLILIAEFLADLGLVRSAAFGIAALIGLAVTVAAAFVAFASLRASLRAFDGSREECLRTIRWVKNTLKHPTPNNRRHAGENGRH
jgi:uncharacterized membrane protein